MQAYVTTVRDVNGDAVVDAATQIYVDTGVLPPVTLVADGVMQDATGALINNPLHTDASGTLSLLAPDGKYVAVIHAPDRDITRRFQLLDKDTLADSLGLATEADLAAETTAREDADIAIDAALSAEIAARGTAVAAEATARAAADTAEATARTAAIASEATARAAADTALQAEFDGAVSSITASFADEAVARTAADAAEITTRAAADTAEAAARAAADTTLQNNIGAEAITRGDADTTEAAARAAADTAEANARAAGDTAVTALVTTETTRAQAAETTLGGLTVTAVKSANYVAAAGDYVPVDASAGNITISLPNAPANRSRIAVKCVALGAGFAVTITAAGADVFNKAGGSTSLTEQTVNQCFVLQYAGGIWYAEDNPSLGALDARYNTIIVPGLSLQGFNATPNDQSSLINAAIYAAWQQRATGQGDKPMAISILKPGVLYATVKMMPGVGLILGPQTIVAATATQTGAVIDYATNDALRTGLRGGKIFGNYRNGGTARLIDMSSSNSDAWNGGFPPNQPTPQPDFYDSASTSNPLGFNGWYANARNVIENVIAYDCGADIGVVVGRNQELTVVDKLRVAFCKNLGMQIRCTDSLFGMLDIGGCGDGLELATGSSSNRVINFKSYFHGRLTGYGYGSGIGDGVRITGVGDNGAGNNIVIGETQDNAANGVAVVGTSNNYVRVTSNGDNNVVKLGDHTNAYAAVSNDIRVIVGRGDSPTYGVSGLTLDGSAALLNRVRVLLDAGAETAYAQSALVVSNGGSIDQNDIIVALTEKGFHRGTVPAGTFYPDSGAWETLECNVYGVAATVGADLHRGYRREFKLRFNLDATGSIAWDASWHNAPPVLASKVTEVTFVNISATAVPYWIAKNPIGIFGDGASTTTVEWCDPNNLARGALVAFASGNSYLAFGAYHDGTNWIALTTQARIVGAAAGVWQEFFNTGLTVGTSFTPTLLQSADASGVKWSSPDGVTRSGLTVFNDGTTWLSSGCLWNGANWVAESATASLIGSNPSNNRIEFYTNTGLTVGNTFTPLLIKTLGANGEIWSSADGTQKGGNVGFNAGASWTSHGAIWDATAVAWRARSTSATILGTNATTGRFELYTDTGLTVGNTFTPTLKAAFTAGTATGFQVADSGGVLRNSIYSASGGSNAYLLGCHYNTSGVAVADGANAVMLFGSAAGLGVYFNAGLTAGNTFTPTLVGTINATGINGTPVGATTPSTGAFATISATGQISPATGTTSLAPIKFTSGPKQTTAAAGSVEYDGTSFALTKSNNIRYRPGGVIFDHFADAGNGTTVETDLYSDTLLGSTLNVNGDTVEGEYAVALVNSTSTKQVKAYFGGTLIFDSGALSTTGAAEIVLFVRITRDSSSSVRYAVSPAVGGLSATNVAPSVGTVTGLTLSATQILKITGTAAAAGAASNDLVAKSAKVFFHSAA